MAHCNVMIYQQVTLSGDAEWPKVADAVIEADMCTEPLRGVITRCSAMILHDCPARFDGLEFRMILGRPQDAMASRFRQAVQFVLGFWAQLAAECEQFCFNHRGLIRGGMV